MDTKKIAVIIKYTDSEKNKTVVHQLKYGLEEEGIPSMQIADKTDSLVLDLAMDASKTSGLDVGIGLDGNGALGTHQINLPEGMLLFEETSSHVNIRTYGANAARLIKGVPLKEYRK